MYWTKIAPRNHVISKNDLKPIKINKLETDKIKYFIPKKIRLSFSKLNISNTNKDKDNISTNKLKIKDIEYTNTLKNALKETLISNEELQEQILFYNKDNEELKKEITEKEDAIIELYKFYKICKNVHKYKNRRLKKEEKLNKKNVLKRKRYYLRKRNVDDREVIKLN